MGVALGEGQSYLSLCQPQTVSSCPQIYWGGGGGHLSLCHPQLCHLVPKPFERHRGDMGGGSHDTQPPLNSMPPPPVSPNLWGEGAPALRTPPPLYLHVCPPPYHPFPNHLPRCHPCPSPLRDGDPHPPQGAATPPLFFFTWGGGGCQGFFGGGCQAYRAARGAWGR